jgi:hypothetical protein
MVTEGVGDGDGVAVDTSIGDGDGVSVGLVSWPKATRAINDVVRANPKRLFRMRLRRLKFRCGKVEAWIQTVLNHRLALLKDRQSFDWQ